MTDELLKEGEEMGTEVTEGFDQAFLEGFEDSDECPQYIDTGEEEDDFDMAFADETDGDEEMDLEGDDGFDDGDGNEKAENQGEGGEDARGKKQNEDKLPETFKVNFMGQEMVVPQSEVKNLVQKGLNHDRMEMKYRKMQTDSKLLDGFKDLAAYYNLLPEKYIQDTVADIQNREINKLVSSGIPPQKARELVGGSGSVRANRSKANGRDNELRNEISEFMNSRPDLKGMRIFPQEVAIAVGSGADLKTAYMRYENMKMAEQLKKLAAQNRDLDEQVKLSEQKKKAANAPKSQKGRGAAAKKTDLFLQGFNEDY